jgi:hypothetical protein
MAPRTAGRLAERKDAGSGRPRPRPGGLFHFPRLRNGGPSRRAGPGAEPPGRGGHLRGPDRPEKVIGWSDCRITDETAAAYADVISAIDSARLPFLLDEALGTGGEDGQGGGGDGEDDGKPKKRGGRRVAVECGCQPPRKLHMTPSRSRTAR